MWASLRRRISTHSWIFSKLPRPLANLDIFILGLCIRLLHYTAEELQKPLVSGSLFAACNTWRCKWGRFVRAVVSCGGFDILKLSLSWLGKLQRAFACVPVGASVQWEGLSRRCEPRAALVLVEWRSMQAACLMLVSPAASSSHFSFHFILAAVSASGHYYVVWCLWRFDTHPLCSSVTFCHGK